MKENEDEGNLIINDSKIEEDKMMEDNQESVLSEENEKIFGGDESVALNLNLFESKLLQKRRKRDGIITMIGLCIQKMEIAVLSSINNASIYYAFYLHTFDNNVTKEDQIILNSVFGLTQASTIWVGGVLQLYIGIRLVMALGNAFLIAGCLGLLFLKNFIGYNFMMAILGIGLGVPGSITNVNAFLYFPKKKAFISGIATISWTLSCSFFNYLSLQICNPHDKKLIFNEKEKTEEDKEKGVEYYDENGDDKGSVINYTIFMLICVIVMSVSSVILTFKFNKENYVGNIGDDDDKEEKKEEEKKEEEKKEEEKKKKIL